MTKLAALDIPAEVHTALDGRNLIVFDGVCVLCARFFAFVLKRDRAHCFDFATAQSQTGQSLYRSLDLPTEAFETLLVVVDGRLYTKAQAFGAVMSRLGFPWRLLELVKHMPAWSTDWAYDLIARRRYRIFGRQDHCLVPDAALRSRFLT